MMTAPISTFAINGGLGNQLFQWFFAHSKMNANSKFKIDPLYPSYQDNNAQNSHFSSKQYFRIVRILFWRQELKEIVITFSIGLGMQVFHKKL
jgi:hypothetical protein